MDEPPLPDDPRDWPTDPFALLGVPRAVTETDLKRAYTRLIRKYKPEHAPDAFRRIREAYESAVETSRWFRAAPPVQDPFLSPPFEPPGRPGPAPDAPPEPAPVEAHRGSEEEPPQETQIDPPVFPAPVETQIDAPVRPAPADAVEDAWADAVAGDWSAAYAALVPLADAHPGRADVPLRLYWLLALRPTLDDARTRHDWLAAALRVSKLSGPAVELYTRELDTDPHVALCVPYLRLLELEGVPADRMLAAARARFAAAGAGPWWTAVEVDLAALAPRAAELDESLWLGYLTEVSGRAAFSQTPAAARCAALLAGLKHLELRHAWAFDRLDEQRASARVWEGATTVPEPIRRAVAVAWTGGDWREPLAAVTAWAAADPCSALRRCDRATREGLPVLAAFGRMLATRNTPPTDYPPHLIRGLVYAHLGHHIRSEYVLMREPLLRFLLAERIDPDELVAACAADSGALVRSITEHVRDDGTLRLVYRAACGVG